MCNIPSSNKQNLFCTSCNLGKAHKLHAPLTHIVYHKAFDVIYTDLWGPYTSPSSSVYRYYIAFVDGHTKSTWLYFLKQKFESLQAFKIFHMFVQTQFSVTVKYVQSDFGGEFRPFTRYLTELGITHRLTCPHTSHKNGTMEIKDKHIIEMRLTILAYSSIPLTYWNHSFSTTVYLINKFLTSPLTTYHSHFHAFYGNHLTKRP